jgi:outer membrane protein OmpA-like peptidoglycan-associated protein
MNRNIRHLLCFVFLILAGYSARAQKVKVDNSDFKRKFQAAEDSITLGNYADALVILDQLSKQDSGNANISFKIGMCYLNSDLEKQKALPFLETAVASINPDYKENDYKERKAPDAALQYLAQAYHLNNRFDEAISTYEKVKVLYGTSNPKEVAQINENIEMCKTGKVLVANPVNIVVTNLGSKINTQYPEYAPVISADESTLIFTSRRPTGTGTMRTEDGKYYEDIYISYKVDGQWTEPKGIANNINTYYHEASIGLSVDAQELFIYKDDNGDGNIYSSKLLGDTWTLPAKLGSNINSKNWETHATVSPDGNTLYFVSDRKGGFGGRDLYFCNRLPSGEWGLAQNAGNVLNTPKEEDAPFIHPDGQKLYFSSKGHNTMGGFDIFVSTLDSTGKWGVPQNLGYPINTSDDDIFYAPTANGKGAYYSSFREGGFGEKDIYLITIPEQKESQLTVYKGVVKDIYGKVPDGMKINVYDNATGDLVGVYTPNSQTGKYLFILTPGINYNIRYEASDSTYLFQSENLDVPLNSAYQVINQAVELKPIKVGQKLILKNIFFDFNSSKLRPASKNELDKLVKVLNANPQIAIEIGAHTDAKGSDEKNLKLSQDRANSMIEYLVGKKIDPKRLRPVGYGETQPIAPNETPDGKDYEAGRQLNRRIECKLLNYDGTDIKIEKIDVPQPVKQPEKPKGKPAPKKKPVKKK